MLVSTNEILQGHQALAGDVAVVGYALGYSVPEMRLPLPTYQNIVKQVPIIEPGFRDHLTLRDLGQVQALMSATTQMVKAMTRDPGAAGYKYFLRDLRQVKDINLNDLTGPREICRVIIREGVDKKQAKWKPTEVAKVYFHVSSKNVRYELIAPDPLVEDRLIAALDDYRRRTKEVSGTRLRDAVKRAFDGLRPISLRRNGGMYFFRADRKIFLDAIQGMLLQINDVLRRNPGMADKDEACEFQVIEIFGSSINRGMIRESALDDARRRMLTASQRLAEISKRKKDGKEVKDHEFEEASSLAREVVLLNKEHRELLGDVLDQLQEEARTLMKQVEAAL